MQVLDPFKAAHVDECYRSSFNPLADLDPQSDETIDEAAALPTPLWWSRTTPANRFGISPRERWCAATFFETRTKDQGYSIDAHASMLQWG